MSADLQSLAPEVRAFAELGSRLLQVLHDESPSAATSLNALIHVYVAVVRTHPQLAPVAQRSLIAAARAVVTNESIH